MVDKWIRLAEQPYTETDAEWDHFVSGHPQGSLLQTTHWARLKNRFGWTSHRVWLKKNGRFVAGAQILFRPIAMRLARFAYIPHGPIVDWANEEQVQVLFNQIDQAIYQHGAGILKMEPLLWQDVAGHRQWPAICRRYQLVTDTDTLQPPQTIMVDLTAAEEEILARMKQKTRYNIRLAAKKGIATRQGGAQDLPHFISLMQITGQRDGFGVRSPDYYRTAYELFEETNQVALYLAELKDRPLAGVMSFKNGPVALNLFSASNNEERQRMPTYAVQWAAMQWAKQQGCTHYDLWGVPDAAPEILEAKFTKRRDGLWGVYRFKRGFGGQIMRTVGAVDRVYNKRLYRLYKWKRK